jgi:hypothetical protein
VYGPVRTVVWQGSAGDGRPYADHFSARTADGGYALFRVRISDSAVERLSPYRPIGDGRYGVSPARLPLVLSSKRIEGMYAVDFSSGQHIR